MLELVFVVCCGKGSVLEVHLCCHSVTEFFASLEKAKFMFAWEPRNGKSALKEFVIIQCIFAVCLFHNQHSSF